MRRPTRQTITDATFALALGAASFGAAMDIASRSWHLLIFSTSVLVVLDVGRRLMILVTRKADAVIGIAEAQRATAELVHEQMRKAVEGGTVEVHAAVDPDAVRH